MRARLITIVSWIASGALFGALLACSGMSGAPSGPAAGGAVGEAPGGGAISTGGGTTGTTGGEPGSPPMPIAGPVAAAAGGSGGILSAPADDDLLGDDCKKGAATTARMHRLFLPGGLKPANDETIILSTEISNFVQGYLLEQGEATVHCLAEAWDFSRYTWTDQTQGAYIRAVVDHITVIPPPPEPDTGGIKILKDPVKKPSHRYQDLLTTEKTGAGINLDISLPAEDGDSISFYYYGPTAPPGHSPALSAPIDGTYAPDSLGEPMLTLKILKIAPILWTVPSFP